MNSFEELLREHRGALERFLSFHLPTKSDADDLLQEICLTAYRKFDTLKAPDLFKPWLLSIARNRCAAYYRARARHVEIPVDNSRFSLPGRIAPHGLQAVHDTLETLNAVDREILHLYYFQDLSQAEIARLLGIPGGTVKSRLYTARRNFRTQYPYPPKGAIDMMKIPEFLPEYKIEPLSEPAFSVKWEELPGWFLIPREGESLDWGIYDFPDKRLTDCVRIASVGKAEVHGITGVEILAKQYNTARDYHEDRVTGGEVRFVAQLTDTHCRVLAESHMEDGVRKCLTFLDGDGFLSDWGFGEDNCGVETHLAPKGLLKREGNVVTGGAPDRETVDVVGRCKVTLGGVAHDTICVLIVYPASHGAITEQYLDKSGRTVLFRRFNRDDWKIDKHGQRWSEKLPLSDRLTVNGQLYVHWYDCISGGWAAEPPANCCRV